MAIKVSGTTVIDNSRNLSNINNLKTVGGESLLGSGDISTGTVLNTPSIATPNSGDTTIGPYTSSAFSAVEGSYNGTHDYSDWEIATDSAFTNVVDSYSGSSNLTSYTQTNTLSPNTTHYVRVRHGSDGHLSQWSAGQNFITPNTYVQAPTITSPSNGATGLPEEVTVQTNAMSVFNGSDTHLSTDWILATDSGFTNIVEQSLNNTSNKTSYTFGQGAYTFVVNTTYYVRVRHKGTTYGNSAYATISFTTNTVFAGEQLYTTAGTYSWVAPTGVTSVSVLCVGAGGRGGTNSYYSGAGSGGALCYYNNYPVTPGVGYTVVVPGTTNGADSTNGGDASFAGTIIAKGGFSAGSGNHESYSSYTTGQYTGGGRGGRTMGNGQGPNGYNGGGGAGGYSGDGGDGGGNNTFSPSPYAGNAGSGGGGGGGGLQGGNVGTGGGGGVGLYGQGSNGAGGAANSTQGGGGGSGGQAGQTGPTGYGSPGGRGGAYGGGGGGSYNNSSNATGAQGAVRIIWQGSIRSFPSTNVGPT